MTARPPADEFHAHAPHAGPQAHAHLHARDGSTVRALTWALILTGAFALVEAAGGWLAGSLALLSD
ncbi:MAG: cation transporter, partial [Betaproteobacteria bacterium]|nr:cation transporter [Betaproteobacteria bacterium]